MANQLANALSPYLLQHKDNPVDWREWGPDAFAEARLRDVPVFLSVGYAACHWCHVMAHESFEDLATADQMNRDFVSIKVDREERPDVDAIYMTATQALTGGGGWPMSVWLDHEGRAFYAGTYYPSRPMPGTPAFRQVLAGISEAWTNRRTEVERAAEGIQQMLLGQETLPRPLPDDMSWPDVFGGAVVRLQRDFDPVNAGFGGAPKFPPSMVLEFLLRHHALTGDERALEMVTRTCEAMAGGGMCDQLGGGFARYSVDTGWVVPHFEKMLYDNALLLRLYTHWWRATHSAVARRVALDTAAFLLRDLRLPEGAFASSLDADSVPPGEPAGHPVEGAAYVWTPAELVDVLGEDDGRWAADVYSVTDRGTFEHGRSTLQLRRMPDDRERLERVRASLLAERDRRPQPGSDDKVVTAWNALAITALVETGVVFDRPDLCEAAEAAGRYLLDRHVTGGEVLRVSRARRVSEVDGLLEDHAALVEAFLALQALTGDPSWFGAARVVLDRILSDFSDGEGGFFDTATDNLVRRPRDPTDNATPSGHATALQALVLMSALTGDADLRSAAAAAARRVSGLMAEHPRFAGWNLAAAVALHTGPVEVGLAGDATGALLTAALRAHTPGIAIARTTAAAEPSIPLLTGRRSGGSATAWVCRDFVCELPVTDPEALRASLANPPMS